MDRLLDFKTKLGVAAASKKLRASAYILYKGVLTLKIFKLFKNLNGTPFFLMNLNRMFHFVSVCNIIPYIIDKIYCSRTNRTVTRNW